MKDLENALRKLSKITPSKGFIKESKNRLLYQIDLQKNEIWFKSFLRRVGIIVPSKAFLTQARVHLIEQISNVKPSWAWLLFAKRLAASTLVMILAVTTTLFFVDGRQIVSASEDTYIEVTQGSILIKHADRLIWDKIDSKVELAEGDLVKLNEDSNAVIHFFDDSQIRLDENSLLLISQLKVSPAYARQGVIEVSLNEGNAWVQTLNVNDDYAGLSLITRDAITRAINATFDVKTNPNDPTNIRVFQNKIEIKTLQPDTREIVDNFKLNEGSQIKITANFNSVQKPITNISALMPQDKASLWVTNNLQQDRDHLIKLNEDEFNRLKLSTGVLPGNMFYPLKQAKERLKLALTFSESGMTEAQIEIANKRLNEAIMLLQEGDNQKATEALMIYQSIAREISKDANSQNVLTNRIVIPHQKTLVASLPTASASIIKEVLNETEESLTENPIEREKVRLQNSIERLYDVAIFIEKGDFDTAKEALLNHTLVTSTVLGEIENIQNEDIQKEILASILELKAEELSLIQVINSNTENYTDVDDQFLSLLDGAERNAEEDVKNTIAFIQPLAPELIKTQQEVKKINSQIQYLVDKINIYQTWQGQKNQITRLLKEGGAKVNNITFLTELRNNLDGRASDLVNLKILELQRTDRYLKHKLVQQKIDRAIRERTESQE